MSLLAVALCERRPEPALVRDALALAGPTARVEVAGDGAVRLLVDAREGLLCAVQAPLLVQMPGEAERLLGAGAPSGAGRWWVEVLSPTPTATRAALAGRVVDHLVRGTGGDAWRGPTGWAVGRLAHLEPEAEEHPAADVTTPSAALVLADRPVVGLDRALADLLATSAAGTDGGRAVHLLTPATSRLTPALADLVRAGALRWLVPPDPTGQPVGTADGDGDAPPWRDALTGQVHHLSSDGRLRPAAGAGGVAESLRATTEDVRSGVVVLEATARHAPGADLELGALAEAVCRTSTGAGPGGWGTAEPATQPWSGRALTRYCRDRAPAPTRLCLVGPPEGPPAAGTLVVRRTRTSVAELVRWEVALSAPPSVQELGERALAVAGAADVESLRVGLRPARDAGAPTTGTAPLAAGVVPVGVLLGRAEVDRLGRDRVRALPVADGSRVDEASGAAWCPVLGGPHPPGEVLGRLLAAVGAG